MMTGGKPHSVSTAAAVPKPGATVSRKAQPRDFAAGGYHGNGPALDACASSAAGNLAIGQLLATRGIHAKLALSHPQDEDEREADRVADAVVSRSPVPPVQRKCSACASGNPCGQCEESSVRRKESSAAPTQQSAMNRIADSIRSAGEPLPISIRREMEPALGRNLASVRIHTGASAGAAARSIHARAFTLGEDVAFAPDEFRPEEREGKRLLAHELTHVVQHGDAPPARILRNGDADAGVPSDAGPGDAPARAPSDLLPNGPDPSGAGFSGITMTTHYPTAISEMYFLVETIGLSGPQSFVDWLAVQGDNSAQALDVSAGVPSDSAVDADKQLRTGVLPTYRTAAAEVTRNATGFLEDFYATATQNALNVLKANEQQAKAEMIRYGITEKQISTYQHTDGGDGAEGSDAGGSSYTEYGMREDSPSGKGLQAAAKILLGRKRTLDATRVDQQNYSRIMLSQGANTLMLKQLDAANAKLKQASDDYLKVRAALSGRFPALAAFSDPDSDNSALETLSEKGPGSDMATMIGERVAKQLERIDTVRNNIGNKGEVNLWRQDKIVGVTRIQTEANSTPWRSHLVDEKVGDEAPGILFDLALAVFNVVALLAAGVTGGLSLAVAAGVNAVVAAQHIQDYLMEQALSGTAFDKAQAISQEEPSLFWLAVEIVGVFADVATAASALTKTFRALKGPVMAVKAAHTAEELEQAENVLRTAAKDAGVADDAEKIVANAKAMRGGGEESLRLAGLEAEEVNELSKVSELTKEERIGEEVGGEAGRVNLSKHGDLYSCASPCVILRDKYATVLASDEGALNRLVELEQRGSEIAEARKTAEAANDSTKLAELDKQANKLKQDVAQFEPTLRAKMPERVAYVKWVESLKGSSKVFDNLDTGALERILQMRPDVQRMKGQLLEELIGARFADKAAREAAAGTKAVEAATKAGSEVEFIPGHLIRDADGRMLTDGVLAYRESNGQLKIVGVVESKAGKASAQKLGRAWKDIPHPADAAQQARWRTMSEAELSQLRKSNRGLAKDIETWREVRMEAIDELRETNPALAGKSSAEIEKQFAGDIDKAMDKLPKGESGQARKSLERLMPGTEGATTEIQIGTQNPDGTVSFSSAQVSGSPKTTKLIGVVPDNVAGKNLQRIAEREKIGFELMNDMGLTEQDLRTASEALNDAAKEPPP